MNQKTFVLVHGAWHGGWCWGRVARLLRAQGHIVFTPTLTGLGERKHLFSPDIDLSTHITDVVNLMKWEELADVVLCGHSYGGMVISGVVEQTESAIASLVFLDAFVPNDGEALADITAPRVKEIIRVAKEKGEQSIPPPPAALFEVNEKDRAWVDGLCGPQPIKTFTEKIALTGARERIAKKTYIRAGTYENPGFDRALDQVKADSSWRTYSVPCGHDVMVDMPEKLAESLVEAA